MWQTEGLYKLSSKFPLKQPPLSKCCSVPNYSQLMCETSKLRVLIIIPDTIFAEVCKLWGVLHYFNPFHPLPTWFIQTLSRTKLKDLLNSRPWFWCLCSVLLSCFAATQASGSKKKKRSLKWSCSPGQDRSDVTPETWQDEICAPKNFICVCERDFSLFIFPRWDF